MKKYDKILGTLLIIFAGALYFYSGTFPVREGRPRVLNAGFYPQLLAIILAVLAVALIITAFIKDYKGKNDVEIWKNTSSLKLFLKTLVMLIIYPYLLTYLGFATATLIFIFIMIYNLFSKEERNIKKLGFISLIITIVIYLVFNEFINIPFPTGGLLI